MRLMLVLLSGCGGAPLDGAWSGECAFADYDMSLDLDLSQEGAVVEGTAMTAFAWQGYDFIDPGTVSGTTADDEATLTLSLDSGAIVHLDMTLASDARMEGSCSDGSTGSGGGWLER